MLYDLLRMDLGDWHPRRIPRTQALIAQQSLSLRPEDAAWLGLLEAGVLWASDPKNPARAVSNEYDNEVTLDDHTRIVKVKGLLDRNPIGGAAHPQRAREPAAPNSPGQRRRAPPGSAASRLGLRPLAVARAKWEERFPDWKWSDPTLTEWQPAELLTDEQKAEVEARKQLEEMPFFMQTQSPGGPGAGQVAPHPASRARSAGRGSSWSRARTARVSPVSPARSACVAVRWPPSMESAAPRTPVSPVSSPGTPAHP